MSTFHVHNLRQGGSPVPAGYNSWIDYWEKRTGLSAGFCKRNGCYKQATDGAHVQIKDSVDRSWYIVPLCHEHNCQFGQDFYVTGPLVPIDPNKSIKW